MGATPLSQFLLSLCQNSQWNYAVFWKVQHKNKMLLTWEDGCCDHPKLIGSMESVPDMCFNGSSEMFSSSWGSSDQDGHSDEYSIGQAVVDLASVQYQWGEGVVGEVACTGKHSWVFSEDIFFCEVESKVVPEFPYELLVQFAAGIKTIVLIPVVPHGVVQLGALEKVSEDLSLIAYVKDKFNAYHIGADLVPLSSAEIQAQISIPLMPTSMDNLNESSNINVNFLKGEDPKAVYDVKSTNDKLPTNDQMMPKCLVQDQHYTSGVVTLDIVKSVEENDFCFRQGDLMRVSKPLNHSLNDTELEVMNGSMVGFSTLQEELQPSSFFDYNMGIFGEHVSVAMNTCVNGDLMEQTIKDMDADNKGHEFISTLFSFPMDCELHKALGPALMEQSEEYLWDPSLANEDASSSPSKVLNGDLIHGVVPSTWQSGEWFAKREDAEHLLEPVVTNIHSSLNDRLSNNPNIKFSVTSLGQFAESNIAQSQSEESACVEEKRVSWSSKTTAFGARARNAVIESPPTCSFGSMISTLTEEQQQKKGYGNMQTRKGSKLSSAGKRRARPGDSKRPRPRDRQLIQDRVKELRELVPSGAKYSIDALLDKTIKHMLFLRSVTDQADKLRHSVPQAVRDRKNLKSSVATQRKRQSGASWAFELGSDFHVCPIVVEDLEHPGQMLIEMLCDDHGLFLEITEVIRRFDLTILNGVMESNGSNTWAHFVVEASLGFDRLDIFWPLLQLLQRTQSPISRKI